MIPRQYAAYRRYLAILILITGCLHPLLSQEAVSLSRDEAAEIIIDLDEAAIRSAGDLLVMSDSLGLSLALQSFAVDRQNLPLRQTRDADDAGDVVNWYYDGDNEHLIIDLRNLFPLPANAATIRLSLAPLNIGAAVNSSRITLSGGQITGDEPTVSDGVIETVRFEIR